MTLHMPGHGHMNANAPRIAAMALLAIPAAILLLFGIGEMAGGDRSGAQHLPESALLLLFMLVAWRHPWGGGVALLTAGSVLLFVWVVAIVFGGLGGNNSAQGRLAAGTILFVPPLLAGALLVWAGRRLWPRA